MGKENSFHQSPAEELESRARLLYGGIENRDATSLERPRKQLPILPQPGFRALKYEHAKLVVAREAGFKDWQMAIDVFEARLSPGDDYGDFWYTRSTDVLLNHWCRNYEEAVSVHQNMGGFLLPYRRQFVVIQNTYIEILGMDPEDRAWESAQYDLAKPAHLPSYRHLVLSRLLQVGC